MIPAYIPVGKYKISVVWFIVLASLIIRLVNYMGIPEGDDLYYTRLAWNAAQGDLRATFIFAVRWMVFLPVAAMYKLFGVSEFTSLAPAWTLSLVSIVLAYYIVKFETNERFAATVTLLYASMPIELVYGSILQVAPNIEFLTLAALFFLQRGIKHDRWFCFVISGLMLGLMPWARITGLIWAPMLVAYLVYKKGFNVQSVIRTGIMALFSVVPFIIQGIIYYIVHNNFLHRFVLSKRVVEYQNHLTGVDAKDLFFYFRTLVIRHDHADYRYYGIIGFILLPAILWLVYRAIKGKAGKEVLFLWWFALYVLFMTFTPTSLHPYTTLIRNIRYGIIFTLPITVIISFMLNDIAQMNKKLQWISTVLFAIIIGINIYSATQLADRFYRRYEKQYTATKWALKQVENSNTPIYLVDINIDRRLQFYSGYQWNNFKIIRSFSQIKRPGYLLILGLGHHYRRFTMTKKRLRHFVHHPPNWATYLGNKRFFRAYKVRAH